MTSIDTKNKNKKQITTISYISDEMNWKKTLSSNFFSLKIKLLFWFNSFIIAKHLISAVSRENVLIKDYYITGRANPIFCAVSLR